MIIPSWERAATELLLAAERRVRLVATCKPVNLEEELAGASAERAPRGHPAPLPPRGHPAPRAPRFRYAPVDHGSLGGELARAADALEAEGDLGAQYAARARELGLEAEMCRVVGTPDLAVLAARRYPGGEEADALAAEWVRAPADAIDPPRSRSDDHADPGSLLSRMRQVVGQRRLPLRVVAAPLLARAATGAGVILVAEGQMLTSREVERTVLHEIDGHAAPRVRARSEALGIFRVGTARGADEQEGYALALEEEGGWLDNARRRELGARHIAARTVRAGAHFLETLRVLEELGAEGALRIAARVHRAGGLARERVYLPAFLRVRARLGDPTVRRVLGAGRVTIGAVALLTPWQGLESWRNSDEYSALRSV